MVKPKQWSRVKGRLPKRLTHVDDRAFRQADAPLGEAVEDELNEIEIGDLVDVDLGHEAIAKCRVVGIVDDVRTELGAIDADSVDLAGPGFVVHAPDGGELVVTLDQVVPGSKARYYFGDDDADRRRIGEVRLRRLLRGIIAEAADKATRDDILAVLYDAVDGEQPWDGEEATDAVAKLRALYPNRAREIDQLDALGRAISDVASEVAAGAAPRSDYSVLRKLELPKFQRLLGRIR